jgi:hypothetical protein
MFQVKIFSLVKAETSDFSTLSKATLAPTWIVGLSEK